MQEDASGSRRHFGLTWWGAALWGFGYLSAFLGVLGGILLGSYLILTSVPWPEVLLVMLAVVVFMVAPGLLMLVWSTNTFTTVTLNDDGLWIRVFLRPRLIPWYDIQRLHHQRVFGHIVYARYISPAHWFVAAPFRQSFRLQVGLQDRETLFWEIYRRASRAQGREIPVEGTTVGHRRF